MDITIFADGACSGNPGPGGWAYAMWKGDGASGQPQIKASGHSPATTNNVMEMTAVLEAFRTLADEASPIEPGRLTLCCDSEYVLKGIFEWMDGWRAKGWRKRDKKPVANVEIWKQIDELVAELRLQGWTLISKHVRGHSGIYGNEFVDELAVRASHGQVTQSDRTGTPAPEASKPEQRIFWMVVHPTEALIWERSTGEWRCPTSHDVSEITHADRQNLANVPEGSRWMLDVENSDHVAIREAGLSAHALGQMIDAYNTSSMSIETLLRQIKANANMLGLS